MGIEEGFPEEVMLELRAAGLEYVGSSVGERAGI